MTMDNTETKLEQIQLPEPSPPKKPYESPRLQEWGSIVELTGGPLGDATDAHGGGSVPF
jgi:hypothetical protein